jgi:hypothetical protein
VLLFVLVYHGRGLADYCFSDTIPSKHMHRRPDLADDFFSDNIDDTDVFAVRGYGEEHDGEG